MQVLERLRETMVSQLEAYIETDDGQPSDAIGEDSVVIDFPDPDGMRKDTMMFIQPDAESLESLSMGSDLATMDAGICILCKGAPNAVLVRRVFAWCNAFHRMIRSNPTLDGFIDASMMTGMEYYPAVTASRTMTAIEIPLQLQWTKEFR